MSLLKDLLYKVEILSVLGSTSIRVNKIDFDSNKISKGDLFVAVKGFKNDGHHFIGSAVENGASVIVCQLLPKNVIKEVNLCFS